MLNPTPVLSTVIFPWNENFNTGIDIIDQQHHQLVNLLNQLASHLAYGVDILRLNQVLDELTEYTQYHFNTEEAVWHAHLPEDEMELAHQRTHQNFIDEVVKARTAIETMSSEKVEEEIISFLTHWLAFHILDNDKHMAKIVIGLQQGLDLASAKAQASVEMTGATRVLIETVLHMYDTLSTRTLQLMREISERQRAEMNLRLSKRVIDNALEAIFIVGADGILFDTNPAFCLWTQHVHDQLVGMHLRQIEGSLFKEGKLDEVWAAARDEGYWKGAMEVRDRSGTWQSVWLTFSAVKNEQSEITHFAGVLSSLSELMERQTTLEHDANHDVLTGLPNRRLLQDRIAQAISRSNRTKKPFTLCFLDLDGFKPINDLYGHDAGDLVLKTIALRIKKILRDEDTIARLGGDEFVLLMDTLEHNAGLETVMHRLLLDIAKPILVKDSQVSVTASVGVVIYPRLLGSPEELLKVADQAMYAAKEAGRSRFQLAG